jgi:hypothetical protein
MNGYQVVTDHILIGNVATPQGDKVNLKDGYVIGISIECLNASADNLMYGLGESPKVVMAPGDPARQYGGFTACGVPCYYDMSISWKFQTNINPQGLVIITRLVAVEKEII